MRTAVLAFFTVFGAGDTKGLNRALAPEGDFRWYTVDDPARPRDFGGNDRRTVLRYFAQRHRARERIQLLSFAFNGNSGSYGHFEFVVLREANDLARTRYEGKGAALCVSGPARIATWAMGRNTR